jgi:flagellar biogenesis protein FliO
MTMPPEVYSLGVVFALLGLLAWWSRRRAAAERHLQVLETAALGQGRAVAVVRAGGKRLLIGVAGQSIATLAELDPADWPEAAEPAGGRLPPLETETP